MKPFITRAYIWIIFGALLLNGLCLPALASVTYNFVVSEKPAEIHFRPLVANMVLSDAAVSAGVARNGQVESIVFGGGDTMQEANRLTLGYLHGEFYDLTVTLSADRQTLDSISAKIRPYHSVTDHWVFHYQTPDHPTLEIHEFVGYIRADSVAIETTILPIPPTHIYTSFPGQWRRVQTCSTCTYFCYPYFWICWIDWIIVVGVITIILMGVILWRRRQKS